MEKPNGSDVGSAITGWHEARAGRDALHYQRRTGTRTSRILAMPPANWSCFRFIPEWNSMSANMLFFWRQQIHYSFERIKGLRNILFGGQGMYMDRFVTTSQSGLLILHGYGNVFERTLKPGKSIIGRARHFHL